MIFILTYYWFKIPSAWNILILTCQLRYSVTFAPDIERGIQIFWFANRGAFSQWKIVKEEKDCGCSANNFSFGNGSPIHGSKDLYAMFNVGGKSNWVRLLFQNAKHFETKLSWHVFLVKCQGHRETLYWYQKNLIQLSSWIFQIFWWTL